MGAAKLAEALELAQASFDGGSGGDDEAAVVSGALAAAAAEAREALAECGGAALLAAYDEVAAQVRGPRSGDLLSFSFLFTFCFTASTLHSLTHSLLL